MPKPIPSAKYGEKAKVSYYIRGRTRTAASRKIAESQTLLPFRVIGNVNSEIIRKYNDTKEFNISVPSNEEPSVRVTGTMQKQFAQKGETIQITLNIQNDSPTSIRGVKLLLISRHQIYDEGGYLASSNDLFPVTNTIEFPEPVKGGESIQSLFTELQIPETALPTVPGNLFTRKYLVRSFVLIVARLTFFRLP